MSSEYIFFSDVRDVWQIFIINLSNVKKRMSKEEFVK